ncbi:hypothetical protein QUA08_14980, partial [Microcoleus sp. T3B2]|uniref:hypothetical protein n=1 Tax=Microcoleus sp. T3B2 TaxID=3055426 RepID=UPI002FCFCC26
MRSGKSRFLSEVEGQGKPLRVKKSKKEAPLKGMVSDNSRAASQFCIYSASVPARVLYNTRAGT